MTDTAQCPVNHDGPLDQRITQESNLAVMLDDDPLTTVVRGTGRSMEDRLRYRDVFIN